MEYPRTHAHGRMLEILSGWPSSMTPARCVVWRPGGDCGPTGRQRNTRGPIRQDAVHGWLSHRICSESPTISDTHIYYGESVAEDPQRVREIEHLAHHLAETVKKENAWAKNMIILGDFNIFGIEDKTYQALTGPGFQIHPKLVGIGSNVDQSKHFDQIAFIAPDLKDRLEECNAGIELLRACLPR